MMLGDFSKVIELQLGLIALQVLYLFILLFELLHYEYEGYAYCNRSIFFPQRVSVHL